jgi:alpha-ribazole phosphatase
MTLWLVRHAKPLVAAGLCYGALDVPACPQDTQRIARELAQQLPPGTAVISSPRQRCEQLAQVLHRLRPDLALKIDERLAEMNFGAWEGRLWAEIGPTEMDAWMQDFAHHAPGGGESVAAFMQRVAGAWEAWVASAQQAAVNVAAPHTLWITHAGVMRAAQLLASGQSTLQNAGQWPREAIGFGQVQKINYE